MSGEGQSRGRFKMDDYVDVAARIAQFAEKYPDGSLQADLEPLKDGDTLVGWLCRAKAYRTPDDPRPGIGHAVEPVPGRTPYTKDSEAMNAETSAWGRAIIALGFQTKKIASANEVRNRQEGPKPLGPPKTWPALTETVSAYDQTTHDVFFKFADAARRLLWPQSTDTKSLTSEDRKFLLQKCAGAAVHLREQFDPNSLPYPTVDDVRACFARVLDGQELALEAEDDKTPLETTGS
jgi:hypothetical protein